MNTVLELQELDTVEVNETDPPWSVYNLMSAPGKSAPRPSHSTQRNDCHERPAYRSDRLSS